MVLKNVGAAMFGAMLLAWSGGSMAQQNRTEQNRADRFLGLDLSTAVLSPEPLGPASRFAPVPVEAGADRGSERSQRSVAHVVHAVKPRAVVLARRRSNPLDAQAFDTRVQVWPCKSGGICNWQR